MFLEMIIMNKLLFSYNDILVEDSRLPVDFGETQAQKDLNQFKENLIDVFNSDDDVFEKRTREALARVESSDDRGMSKSQFLDELDSW